jgi:hypothetical protein
VFPLADRGNYVNFAPSQGSRLLRIRTEVLPMPRRSARSAPTGGGDTNHTVLVIFLVFFVLISLTLGVFLYLAQEKISAADTAKDKAQKDLQAADKERNEYRDYFRAKFQSWVDPASLGEDELQTMQTLDKDETFRSKRPEKFAALQKDMEGDPNANTTEAKNGLVGPMDPATGRPANPLRGKLKALEQQLATTTKNYNTKQKELDTLKAEYSQYQKDWNSANQSAAIQKSANDAEAQKKQALDQKGQELADARAKITATTQSLAQELEKTKKEFDEREKKTRAEVDEEKDKLAKLQQEIRIKNTARQLVQLDKPRGRVVRIDRNGETAYIDLGTDAHVPPQTTFSVYGRGPGGKVLPEPKAKFEYVRPLDRTLGLVRVTALAKPSAIRAEADPDRPAYWITDTKQFYKATDPILPDDLIFNPIWDPERSVHVALVGSFDIDGDGQDDLDALIRMLRDMGVTIDAYPDLKEGYKVIGRIDYQTDYLVVGSTPPTQVGRKNVDNRREFEEQARSRGIEILRLQRFLDRIGYSSIRVPTPKAGSGLAPLPTPKEEPGKKEEAGK